MKIVYNQETKRIPNIDQIQDLITHIKDTFQIPPTVKLGTDLKMFYNDEDGDTITVTTQTDLSEANKAMKGQLKLVLAPNSSAAQSEITSQFNRSMSIISGIQPASQNQFAEDFDKSLFERPMTER